MNCNRHTFAWCVCVCTSALSNSWELLLPFSKFAFVPRKRGRMYFIKKKENVEVGKRWTKKREDEKSKSTSNKQIEQLAARTHYDQLQLQSNIHHWFYRRKTKKTNSFFFLVQSFAFAISFPRPLALPFLAIVEKETFLRVFCQL